MNPVKNDNFEPIYRQRLSRYPQDSGEAQITSLIDMQNTFWRWVVACLLLVSAGAIAGEREVYGGLSSVLSEKPIAVRKSLIDGFYIVYFTGPGKGRTAYADESLSVFGNSTIGYMHLSGPHKGQDLTSTEKQDLYQTMLAKLDRSRFPKYVFGKGGQEFLLFTAYDCPYCYKLEGLFTKQAKQLDATVYIVPTGLHYFSDPGGQNKLLGVICSPDKGVAWRDLIVNHKASPASCDQWTDDYATLAGMFPTVVPTTVPTVITLRDGRVYQTALTDFNRIFSAR